MISKALVKSSQQNLLGDSGGMLTYFILVLSLCVFHFRDLPLCLGISMTIVTGCYVLINVAYIAVLGKANILRSPAVALVGIYSV